jgi:hypothetical protein
MKIASPSVGINTTLSATAASSEQRRAIPSHEQKEYYRRRNRNSLATHGSPFELGGGARQYASLGFFNEETVS